MLNFLTKYIFGTAVPIMLVISGIYYMFYLKAFHIVKLKMILKSLFRKPQKCGVSPLRALTLALAGTLGVGNIVGVSAAIYLGGFGAIFWMWVSAFLAMLLKYAEVVLAIKHRWVDNKGIFHGSAMYYIRDYFEKAGFIRIGKIIGFVFAIFCVLNSMTMGSMIQTNSVSSSLENVFNIFPIVTGLVLALISAFIIAKGSDGMSRFTEKLVPFMTFIYIILSVAVLIIKADKLPSAFTQIFVSAFDKSSICGGISGFFLSKSLRYGVMRGLISNEAGCGTAPMAHATSNTKSPAEQGFLGIFEVFVDTIVLCTMTALVVIVSYDNVEHFGDNFIMMTIGAYSSVLGKFSEYILSISVLFFAFATIICWGHYGIESWTYIKNGSRSKKAFIYIYCVSIFIGAILSPNIIWDLADISIGVMSIINIVMLYLMRKEVKVETRKYFRN